MAHNQWLDEDCPPMPEDAPLPTSSELLSVLRDRCPLLTWEIGDLGSHYITVKATVNGQRVATPFFVSGEWIRNNRLPGLLTFATRAIAKALLDWKPAGLDGGGIEGHATESEVFREGFRPGEATDADVPPKALWVGFAVRTTADQLTPRMIVQAAKLLGYTEQEWRSAIDNWEGGFDA